MRKKTKGSAARKPKSRTKAKGKAAKGRAATRQANTTEGS